MVDGRDELNHGKRNLPSQHTSFEAKGLQQHVEYQFWVTASTRIGEGQSSKVVAQVPTSRGNNIITYILVNYSVSWQCVLL